MGHDDRLERDGLGGRIGAGQQRCDLRAQCRGIARIEESRHGGSPDRNHSDPPVRPLQYSATGPAATTLAIASASVNILVGHEGLEIRRANGWTPVTNAP